MELQIIESADKPACYVLLDARMRLVKEVNDYLGYLRICRKAENTILAYGRDLCVYFAFLERNLLDFDSIDTDLIQEYVAFLRSPYEDGQFLQVESPRTPATINRMIAALYGFYCHHAAIHGTANPLIKISDGKMNSVFKGMLAHTKQSNFISGSLFRIKQSSYRIHLFTEDEVELLESMLPTKRDKLIFRLLLGTGARIGELLNLELRNVPVPNESSSVSIMHQVISKGGMRDIFIPAVLLEDLDDFILNERARVAPDHDWVFFSQSKKNDGAKLKYRAIYDVFKRAGKRIGLDFRFHDTRHTFITNLVESGMDISIVRIIAGHKHVTTTQNYVTLSNRFLMESLSAYWDQSTLLKRGDNDGAL
jgi:site-specific recombinase XerD